MGEKNIFNDFASSLFILFSRLDPRSSPIPVYVIFNFLLTGYVTPRKFLSFLNYK